MASHGNIQAPKIFRGKTISTRHRIKSRLRMHISKIKGQRMVLTRGRRR